MYGDAGAAARWPSTMDGHGVNRSLARAVVAMLVRMMKTLSDMPAVFALQCVDQRLFVVSRATNAGAHDRGFDRRVVAADSFGATVDDRRQTSTGPLRRSGARRVTIR